MVKLFLALVLAACAATASATDVDTKAPKNPAIKTVIIEKNAAWFDGVSSDEPPDACNDFVLTESDIREFFRRARPATHTEYVHDLLMSRCHVSGRVVLKDGREAAFHIDRARRGRLRFEDMTSWHYFCGKCRGRAYGEACDIECIHGPSTNDGDAPKHQPAVKKIIIDENGAWSDKRSSSDETPENCASFILKESDARRFFKLARFSSSHEQVRDLEVSRCYAAGHAVLQDGREATWLIDRARQGVFEFADGSALYFYCKKCSRGLYWSE